MMIADMQEMRGKFMKKRRWFIELLLVGLLTGCAPLEGTEPAAKLPEESVETERPAPERILLSEAALAYTYRDGRPNGFDFGGVEENGVFFYEFTRPEEPDFSLRISEDEKVAVVCYHGKTMVLKDRVAPNGSLLSWHISAGYGGAVSGYGMPFWVDMTGDGQPDLLYLQGGGGTGAHTDWCVAYDMATMTEITIVEPWEELSGYIDVEPLEWKDGRIICRVTDGDGRTYLADQPAQEDGWQNCVYRSGKSGYATIDIDEEAAVLRVSMAFGMEVPHVFGTYMGDLETELAYDAEQNAIVRSESITVSVYGNSEG